MRALCTVQVGASAFSSARGLFVSANCYTLMGFLRGSNWQFIKWADKGRVYPSSFSVPIYIWFARSSARTWCGFPSLYINSILAIIYLNKQVLNKQVLKPD